MVSAQEQYDEAMHAFSRGEYASAAAQIEALLAAEPDHFDARLSLGMAYYRLGDFQRAIAEGHKAERMRPNEQLVHTNLSLFYLKAGDKAQAEHHGLQARIASWRGNLAPPKARAGGEAELRMAQTPPPAVQVPDQFPEMPWKKKPPAPAPPAPPTPDSRSH
jgi:tetratricopeptide (TPR) repeat protein